MGLKNIDRLSGFPIVVHIRIGLEKFIREIEVLLCSF